MTTPAIANPVIIQQNPMLPARQPDAPESGTPFNQVLSREMADRSSVNEAQDARPDDVIRPNPANPASGKPVKKTSAKETVEDNGATTVTDISAQSASAATDMLALISTIGQLASTGTDRQPDAASASPEAIPAAIDAARSPVADRDTLLADFGKPGSAADAKTVGAKVDVTQAALLPDSRFSPSSASAPVSPPADPRGVATGKDALDPEMTSASGHSAGTDLQGIAARSQKNHVAAAQEPARDQKQPVASLRSTAEANSAAKELLPAADAKADVTQAALLPDSRFPSFPASAPVSPPADPRGMATGKDALDPEMTSASGHSAGTDLRGIAARSQKNHVAAAQEPARDQKQPVASLDQQEKAQNSDSALPFRAGFAANPDTERTKEVQLSNSPAIAASLPQAAMNGVQAVAAQTTEKLTPRVGSPAWDQALGQKVIWMVAGDQQNASLTLNPPDLGPLQVVLSVSNGHADAAFFAAQPEVRQAIEAAMPKLREMLGDAGIQLGQASVGAGSPGQNSNPGSQFNPTFHAAGRSDGSADTTVQIVGNPTTTGPQGLVDTFV